MTLGALLSQQVTRSLCYLNFLLTSLVVQALRVWVHPTQAVPNFEAILLPESMTLAAIYFSTAVVVAICLWT